VANDAVSADGADGADAGGSVLDSRAYPDRPCSRAPLSAEGYFDAQHAKERLRATQTASEGAGMFWPVRALFRDIVTGPTGGQKVRGRSHPTAAFRGGVEHAR
jgi:hypothetical protein